MERPKKGEDVFHYIQRIRGEWDINLYRQIAGAANAFKEGSGSREIREKAW